MESSPWLVRIIGSYGIPGASHFHGVSVSIAPRGPARGAKVTQQRKDIPTSGGLEFVITDVTLADDDGVVQQLDQQRRDARAQPVVDRTHIAPQLGEQALCLQQAPQEGKLAVQVTHRPMDR
jgi:hypothetical protein